MPSESVNDTKQEREGTELVWLGEDKANMIARPKRWLSPLQAAPAKHWPRLPLARLKHV
jgi:hypothetical protein